MACSHRLLNSQSHQALPCMRAQHERRRTGSSAHAPRPFETVAKNWASCRRIALQTAWSYDHVKCKPAPAWRNRNALTDDKVIAEQPTARASPTDVTQMHTVHTQTNLISTSMTAGHPTLRDSGVSTKPRETVHFAVLEATVTPGVSFNLRASRTRRRFARQRLPTATPIATSSVESRADPIRPKFTPGGLVSLLV